MNLSASGSITLRGSATLSATYAPTGRLITADAEYALIREWAELPDQDLQQRHDAGARFAAHLTQVTRFAGASLLCCRGRRFPSAHVPTSDEMGPPPMAVASKGRYNKSGESVLYLCESDMGVVREPIGGDGQLWIQRFVLPLDGLAIADFSSLRADDFASKVFWFAELAGIEGVAHRIRFSQLVASIVAQKFDGMRIPGVRGGDDVRYSNIVVFRAERSWRDWLEIGSQPSQLAPDGFV
jgi:hypothetical protein